MESIARGLDGIVVNETAVSLVDPKTDSLYYRGYSIEELAEHARYEEVAFLLLYGELPGAGQLKTYRRALSALRSLPQPLQRVLEQLPRESDPMDVLRTGCSVLGSLEPEDGARSLIDIGNRLLACLPSMLLYWYHYQHSGKSISTDSGEPDAAGHLLHLLHGSAPDPLHKRAIEVSLIVYAEHDFNASTFAARVAISTLSDAYSAFVAAIAALRGPLHGSANAAVLRFISQFNSPAAAEAAVREMLARKVRIPGFGQRVYNKADPRNAINKTWARKLSAKSGDTLLYDIAERIEQLLLREKAMFANLDYYTAIIYQCCGLPVGLFAPMFFMARICGLTAHVAEQRANNRLIHPSSHYTGPQPKSFPPLGARPA